VPVQLQGGKASKLSTSNASKLSTSNASKLSSGCSCTRTDESALLVLSLLAFPSLHVQLQPNELMASYTRSLRPHILVAEGLVGACAAAGLIH
jgi:hypothetical protein